MCHLARATRRRVRPDRGCRVRPCVYTPPTYITPPMHTARNRPVPRRALIACHHLGRDPACHRPPPDCGVWSSPSPPPRLRTPHTTLRARMPSPPQRIMCAHTNAPARARVRTTTLPLHGPPLARRLSRAQLQRWKCPQGKGRNEASRQPMHVTSIGLSGAAIRRQHPLSRSQPSATSAGPV